MNLTTDFDECNIDSMKLNEINEEAKTIDKNIHNIQFCINLTRSKECDQKGSIYLYSFNSEIVNWYTIIPKIGKNDIEKFVSNVMRFDSPIICSNS